MAQASLAERQGSPVGGRVPAAGGGAVEIPKPNGGVRLLGIPTVVDRLIQQALLQILQPIFEAEFSKSSYGFIRPVRGAHPSGEGMIAAIDPDLLEA